MSAPVVLPAPAQGHTAFAVTIPNEPSDSALHKLVQYQECTFSNQRRVLCIPLLKQPHAFLSFFIVFCPCNANSVWAQVPPVVRVDVPLHVWHQHCLTQRVRVHATGALRFGGPPRPSDACLFDDARTGQRYLDLREGECFVTVALPRQLYHTVQ